MQPHINFSRQRNPYQFNKAFSLVAFLIILLLSLISPITYTHALVPSEVLDGSFTKITSKKLIAISECQESAVDSFFEIPMFVLTLNYKTQKAFFKMGEYDSAKEFGRYFIAGNPIDDVQVYEAQDSEILRFVSDSNESAKNKCNEIRQKMLPLLQQ